MVLREGGLEGKEVVSSRITCGMIQIGKSNDDEDKSDGVGGKQRNGGDRE